MQDSNSDSAATPLEGRRGPDPSPLRLLLVEDNGINLKVAVRMLQRLGYHAETVCDGREAVNTAAATPFDIILMDVHMPVLDGLEATKEIRKLDLPWRQPKIVAMTAAAMADDERRCRDAGMDDYLTKPIKLRALQETLERVTRSLEQT
jgi:CheY-like chemotaxis protein